MRSFRAGSSRRQEDCVGSFVPKSGSWSGVGSRGVGYLLKMDFVFSQGWELFPALELGVGGNGC